MDLHISNLPFKLKEEELLALFQEFGEVSSAKIIKNHQIRQSKGYGFVTMPNKEEALKAMAALKGKKIQDRALDVTESVKREDRKKIVSKVAAIAKFKKKKGLPIVTFDGDTPKILPGQRKKRRGQGRGTKY